MAIQKRNPTHSPRSGHGASSAVLAGLVHMPFFEFSGSQSLTDQLVTGYTAQDFAAGQIAATATTIGSVVDTGLSDAINQLTAEMERLRVAVEAISDRLDEISIKLDAEEVPLRELSDEEGLAEIKQYFETHHGETIYPSDISEQLHIAYETVTRLVATLELEGRISKS